MTTPEELFLEEIKELNQFVYSQDQGSLKSTDINVDSDSDVLLILHCMNVTTKNIEFISRITDKLKTYKKISLWDLTLIQKNVYNSEQLEVLSITLDIVYYKLLKIHYATLEATKKSSAMVVDKKKNAIRGIVINLSAKAIKTTTTPTDIKFEHYRYGEITENLFQFLAEEVAKQAIIDVNINILLMSIMASFGSDYQFPTRIIDILFHNRQFCEENELNTMVTRFAEINPQIIREIFNDKTVTYPYRSRGYLNGETGTMSSILIEGNISLYYNVIKCVPDIKVSAIDDLSILFCYLLTVLTVEDRLNNDVKLYIKYIIFFLKQRLVGDQIAIFNKDWFDNIIKGFEEFLPKVKRSVTNSDSFVQQVVGYSNRMPELQQIPFVKEIFTGHNGWESLPMWYDNLIKKNDETETIYVNTELLNKIYNEYFKIYDMSLSLIFNVNRYRDIMSGGGNKYQKKYNKYNTKNKNLK